MDEAAVFQHLRQHIQYNLSVFKSSVICLCHRFPVPGLIVSSITKQKHKTKKLQNGGCRRCHIGEGGSV